MCEVFFVINMYVHLRLGWEQKKKKNEAMFNLVHFSLFIKEEEKKRERESNFNLCYIF